MPDAINPVEMKKKSLSFLQIFGFSALIATGLLFFLIVSGFFLISYGHQFRLNRWQYSLDNYNEELESLALSKELIGSEVGRIPLILGPPTNVRTFWTVLGVDGQPKSNSEYVTTYEYYPNPFVPFSKFQVHTVDGIVQNLEKYDD